MINLQDTTFLGILLAALLVLAFTISGAEVALFSLNHKDVNVLKTKQHTGARRIVSLLEEPKEVYASLMIAGTFINICIIVLANFLITQLINLERWGGLLSIISRINYRLCPCFFWEDPSKGLGHSKQPEVCVWLFFCYRRTSPAAKKDQPEAGIHCGWHRKKNRRQSF